MAAADVPRGRELSLFVLPNAKPSEEEVLVEFHMLFPHGDDAWEECDGRSLSPLPSAMPPRLAMLRARTPGAECVSRGVPGNQGCEKKAEGLCW